MAKEIEPLWKKNLVKPAQVTEEVTVKETPTEVKATEQVKVKPPVVDQSKFLGGVFDKRPVAPKYNIDADRRDKATMDAQAMGNLLALVGDLGGVALGADVSRREPKSLEPYMASMQNRRAQFEKDQRIFSRQDFERDLAFAQGKQKFETAAEKTAYERGQDVLTEERLGRKDILAETKETRLAKKQAIDIEDRATRTKGYIQNIERLERQGADKDKKPAFRITIENESIDISESDMKDFLIEEGYTPEDLPTGDKGETEAFRIIREKANKHAGFKAWLLQKNKEGGEKNYKKFIKSIPVGPERENKVVVGTFFQ